MLHLSVYILRLWLTPVKDFHALYKWSCSCRNQFWSLVWDTVPLIYEGSYAQPVDESVPISHLPRWFEGVRLNWTENFLWSPSATDGPGTRTQLNKEDAKVALTEVREGNTEVRHLTWGELRARVAELATALKERGVEKGDRVVLVGAHSASTLVVFLAAAWLGALFSSSSTDMGVGGLLQRTVQIDPKASRVVGVVYLPQKEPFPRARGHVTDIGACRPSVCFLR